MTPPTAGRAQGDTSSTGTHTPTQTDTETDPVIDKRDFDAHRPLLLRNGYSGSSSAAGVGDGTASHSRPRSTSSVSWKKGLRAQRSAESQRQRLHHLVQEPDEDGLLSDVVEGIVERDRRKMQREVVRVASFVLGVISCLGAGSITTFSLYGPLFLSRLHYSQLRVNAVAIAAEIALYLPVPVFGYLCDRYSPSPLSLLSGLLFGSGYLLAALAYRSGPPVDVGGSGWPFAIMVVAFVAIGAGTCSMYIAAVTTCAKNFGRGKHKGIMLAMPIAAFGLSGMWQSQVGTYVLCERDGNGRCGDVDVFRYFVFLAVLLFSTGMAGTFGLRIVGDEVYIDEAVEELERSGLLGESGFFQSRSEVDAAVYGTFAPARGDGVDVHREDNDEVEDEEEEEEEMSMTLSEEEREAQRLEKEREEVERRKKNWVLNYETRLFLQDRTMWWLALGFFLVTGPGEAYINNLGTIIQTLSPATLASGSPPPAGRPSTHVTTIALTSTIARLLTGSLSDIFAPPATHHMYSSSIISRPSTIDQAADDNLPLLSSRQHAQRFTFSRLYFLLPSALLLSLGFLLLVTPFPLHHPQLFHLSTALVGLGYGSAFSMVPIIISVVWGVENFGTNWGIVAMVPAAGAAVWGLVYSRAYQDAAAAGPSDLHLHPYDGAEDGLCHGWRCYGFWAMGCTLSVWAAIAAWAVAWRGWKRRGVVV